MTTPKAGDKFHCTDPVCRSEVAVAAGSAVPQKVQDLVCSCGAKMARGWPRPVWIPSLRRAVRPGLR